MGEEIIKVEGLCKRFIITHEERERYKSLRDVFGQKTKSLFSRKRNAQIAHEEFWALNDVTFNIQKGDRVGIIGRNGAGKSTLLKILSRITEPTKGRITIDGRVASLLEVGTGFHPELTGRENIFLNGAILGMSRAEIRAKFDEIVAFAEVEKFLDTPVKRYSSGMYVRLAFAVAAHLEPEILIVDEVLAVGDAQFQKKCLGKMEDVSKNEGRTVLFVSHNMGVISSLCSTAILLSHGEIQSYSNVQQVVETYISSAQSTSDVYVADPIHNKRNFFSRIFATNLKGSETSDFSFSENIVLNFSFVISEDSSNLQIGIGLNDKFSNRVFTIIRPIPFFKKQSDKSFAGKVLLPSKLIAPNVYNFTFAIWTKDGKIYDHVENICHVRIFDDGTELASYEGVNYGSVIIDPEWIYD